MIIIGVDYHPSFQQIAFLDQETGECGERQLNHSDGEAERFYRELQPRGVSVRVGMEATGHSRWFERLLAELGFEVWIGDAAEIKKLRVRKQKTDREDARLMRKLLLENRFPRIWVPSPENRDLRQLLWHRQATSTGWRRVRREPPSLFAGPRLAQVPSSQRWRKRSARQIPRRRATAARLVGCHRRSLRSWKSRVPRVWSSSVGIPARACGRTHPSPTAPGPM